MSLTQFRAYQLSKVLYQGCQGIRAPAYVKDQLMRAALSVAANLGEGSGKSSPKDRCRFYGVALGSLREVQVLLELHGTADTRAQADRAGGAIYCLVRALERAG